MLHRIWESSRAPAEQLKYRAGLRLAQSNLVAQNKGRRGIGEERRGDAHVARVRAALGLGEVVADIGRAQLARKGENPGGLAQRAGAESNLGGRAHDAEAAGAPDAVQQHAVDGRREAERAVDQKIVPRVALVGACHGNGVCDVVQRHARLPQRLAAGLNCQVNAGLAEQGV